MVNIGIIGCGGIMTHHALRLITMPEVRIAALCDIRPEATRKLADQIGSPSRYDDVEALLNHDHLEAVMVGTPTHLHVEPAIAGLRAGKHVFVEKPVTRTLTDCDRLLAAEAESPGTLTVGFVRRYDADWGTLSRIITEGQVGRPVIWRFLSGMYRPDIAWFTDDTQGGGPLLDGAIHNYDFALQRLFGPARRVLAAGMQWDAGLNRGMDTGSVIIEFESGDQFVTVWSWGVERGGIGSHHVDVLGPLGAVTPGLTDEQRPPDFDPDMQDAYFVGAAGNAHAEVFPKEDMFANQMRYWVDTCLGKVDPMATGQHGREALQLAIAVLEAMKIHGAVDVASVT